MGKLSERAWPIFWGIVIVIAVVNALIPLIGSRVSPGPPLPAYLAQHSWTQRLVLSHDRKTLRSARANRRLLHRLLDILEDQCPSRPSPTS